MITGIYQPFSDEGAWCLTRDEGSFDLIVLQSDHLSLLQFCQGQLQEYFNGPLTILPYEETRKLDWKFRTIELPGICCKNEGVKA